MYIKLEAMYMPRPRAHKHFNLDAIKITRAQRALSAKTESETIERALPDRDQRRAPGNPSAHEE